MIRRLYERLTGQPWATTRSMAAEFGPPPAVRYPELAAYSDLELIQREMRDILAEIERKRGKPVTIDPETLAALARIERLRQGVPR
jgi:hypothetical protein